MLEHEQEHVLEKTVRLQVYLIGKSDTFKHVTFQKDRSNVLLFVLNCYLWRYLHQIDDSVQVKILLHVKTISFEIETHDPILSKFTFKNIYWQYKYFLLTSCSYLVLHHQRLNYDKENKLLERVSMYQYVPTSYVKW